MSKPQWRLHKEVKLNNCRYCLSDEVEVTTSLNVKNNITIYVECRTCHARGPINNDTDAAIIDWNGANE